MKKLFIFLFLSLFFISFASAEVLRTNVTFIQTAANNEDGLIYFASANQQITSIGKFPSAQLSSCYISENSTGSIIASGTFGGNSICNITASLNANSYYRIVTVATGTTYYNNTITFPLSYSGYGSFTVGCYGTNCVNQDALTTVYEITNMTSTLDNNNITYIYNTTTYETSYENIYSMYESPSSISSVRLNYNGTSYGATSTFVSGTNYTLNSYINIPLVTNSYSINNFFWDITYSNGSSSNLTFRYQTALPIIFNICNSSINIKYLNYTFKNETAGQERLNGSMTGSFNYWLGTGTINKTYSFSNSTENREYNFCFSPQTRGINIKPSITYSNSYSQQRSYSTSSFFNQNTTNSISLYLLPTYLGSSFTFQIINQADQSIVGAVVNLSRSGFGQLESRTTSDSGTASFFINPLVEYTVCASASGYDMFCTTDTFNSANGEYTISLGSSQTTTNSPDYTRGISYSIKPIDIQLDNRTDYTFNFTLSSSYWSPSSFGFVLVNSSGYVIGNSSLASPSGSTYSIVNTGNYSRIIMNAYWIINGTYTNITKTYIIIPTGDTSFSITNFFTRLSYYISNENDTDGLFGLQSYGDNNFSMALIMFFIIFASAGVLNYKYGGSSPVSILLFVFSLTLIADVGLGLIPRPVSDIPFATIMIGLMLLVALAKEYLQ